jgi:hypothetical protein
MKYTDPMTQFGVLYQYWLVQFKGSITKQSQPYIYWPSKNNLAAIDSTCMDAEGKALCQLLMQLDLFK